jgi:hypothetical protein
MELINQQLKKYLHKQICMEIFSAFLRDFRHTFNPQTERPWGGLWSASNFYDKYHILIAVVTDEHIDELTEENVAELYKIAHACSERIVLKKCLVTQ